MQIGSKQILVLGPPGCGKTTDLLKKVEGFLADGMSSRRIAFVSFTRKAVYEAMGRACTKFGLNETDFPYFKTIHSLCFSLLRARRDDMMGRENFRELGKMLGYKFDGTYDESETGMPQGGEVGDKLLFLDSFARVTMKPLKEAWALAMADINWHQLDHFSTALRNYKKSNGILDFTDLLQRVVEREINVDVDVLFVDEAQDLSPLQWAVLQRVFADVPLVFIAGDDDQSIYRWSGADVETFLNLPGDKQLLTQSHRLPLLVYNAAGKIIKQVKHRYEKPYKPTDKRGEIQRLPNFDQVKFATPEGETTLCLARNVYLLERFEEHLRKHGILYSKRAGHKSVKKGHVEAILGWEALRRGQPIPARQAKYIYEQMAIGEVLGRGGKAAINKVHDEILVDLPALQKDYKLLTTPIWHDALVNIPIEDREYYLAMMRAGTKFLDKPRVQINTVHGVKGGEADHVILMSDIAYRTYQEWQKDPDSEHRVAYVAVTRAKTKLTIIQPQTHLAYPYTE